MARADLAAAQLLEKFEITDVPIDPRSIAEQLGAMVVARPMERDVSGMLLREGNSYVIGVNKKHPANRQRFTIGHEIGHLQLHRGRELILDTAIRVNLRDNVSSLATDREEIEANRFAAALLMPAGLVIQEAWPMSQLDPDAVVRQLALRFKVSEAAMSYRLINLGVLS